jgi:hypothetical protein
MLPLLERIGFIAFDQQAANQPLIKTKQRPNAQFVTKCRWPSPSQFLSRFPTAVDIMQHN